MVPGATFVVVMGGYDVIVDGGITSWKMKVYS